MKSTEKFVDKKSDYFLSSPSANIAEALPYPTAIAHFYYHAGYRKDPIRYDGFLLMCVLKGSLILNYANKETPVYENSFFFISCYEKHGFRADVDCDTTWILFNGPTVSKIYSMITSKLGNVFSLLDPLPVINQIARVYRTFVEKESESEILNAKYLNDLMAGLLLYTPAKPKRAQRSEAIENAKDYVKKHFQEELPLEELARQALMSPYYFIRVFKAETGMSPHEYIVNYRITMAKLLLLGNDLTVSEICYETGFSSESVFCAAFKKRTGLPPGLWRKKNSFHESSRTLAAD